MSKEKLLIENLLSSSDLFSRCVTILQPNYFEQPEHRPVIKFIIEYFNKYNNIPSFDIVNAEYDLKFTPKQLTLDQFSYTCDEVEKFCKDAAIMNALREVIDNHMEKREYDIIRSKFTKALEVSLQKDLGQDIYENPEDALNRMIDTAHNYSTSIESLDINLDGGLAKKTFTLFSANSGVGKSNMLANLGANYSINPGFNVLYISLELPEDMIRLRISTIISGFNISLWKTKIIEIAQRLLGAKQAGAGTYRVKRMPSGSNANAIRSYLKHYEIEYKCKPDVIIIDYLDLMAPNNGTKNKSIFDQDKEKSEEITEILVDYNAIGISASQQNREALRMDNPDQAVIAGGISKVNTVHNYISLKMDEVMAIRGELLAFFLKLRTAKKVDKPVMLNFNEKSLRISDPLDEKKNPIVRFMEKRKKSKLDDMLQGKVKNIVDNNKREENNKADMFKDSLLDSESSIEKLMEDLQSNE